MKSLQSKVVGETSGLWERLVEEMSSEHQAGRAIVVGSSKLLFIREDQDKDEKLEGGNSGNSNTGRRHLSCRNEPQAVGCLGLLWQGASG